MNYYPWPNLIFIGQEYLVSYIFSTKFVNHHCFFAVILRYFKPPGYGVYNNKCILVLKYIFLS